jgi:hypothetical protein
MTPDKYDITDTLTCESCAGQGYDWSDKWEYDPCTECQGTGRLQYKHNLLKEAFFVANQDGRARLHIDHRHLQALISHFNDLLSELTQIEQEAQQIDEFFTPEARATLTAAVTDMLQRQDKG